MHIVFQRPEVDLDDDGAPRWALFDAGGAVLSWWSSPEAALIEASIRLDVDLATLRLVREDADHIRIAPRT